MGCTLIACLAAAAWASSAFGQVQYWVDLDGGDIEDQTSMFNLESGESITLGLFIDEIPPGPDVFGCDFCIAGYQVQFPNVMTPVGPAVPPEGVVNGADSHPNGLTNIPGGCAFPDCFTLAPVMGDDYYRIVSYFNSPPSVPVTGPTYIGGIRIDVGDAPDGIYTLQMDAPFSFIEVDHAKILWPWAWTPLTIIVGPSRPFIIHESGEAASTAPCSGHIDPLWESSNGTDHNQGLTSADILFSEPVFGDDSGGVLTVANFTLTDCDGEAGPTVIGVEAIDGNAAHIRVYWDGFPALGKWTTIKADVWSATGLPIVDAGDLGSLNEPDRVDFAVLPGDVDNNGVVQALDLLRMRQRLLNGCTVACPDCGGRDEFYFDIGRSGSIDALDLLRWRQLWFGAGSALMAWEDATLSCDRP
jgi:hypothetical protein